MLDLSVLNKIVTLLPSPPAPGALPALVEQSYNKDELVRLYTHALVPFYEREKARHVELKPNARKELFVEQVAAFYADAERLRAFVAGREPALGQAFERLVWFGPCTLGRLAHDLGRDVVLPSAFEAARARYGYGYHQSAQVLPDEYGFFSVESDYYTRHPHRKRVRLAAELRSYLQTVLPPPAAATLHPLPEPPDGLRYDVEATILNDLLRYDLFVRDGHLEKTKTGRPKKGSLRQMEHVAEVKEFFPDGKGPLSQLATELLAEVLAAYAPAKAPAGGLALLEAVLQAYFAGPTLPLADLFLAHLKQRGNAFDSYRDRQARLVLLELLRRLPPDRWVSVDALHDHAVVHNLPLQLFTERDLAGLKVDHVARPYVDLRRADEYGFYSYYPTVGLDYADDAVTRPLVRGHFALMAVLGVVEVAYERPENDVVRHASQPFLTPFDGVRAARLTALGAYLLGKTEAYAPPAPVAQPEAQVVLDDTYLVFTLSAEDKLKQMIAEGLAERLGPRRYRLNYTAFLRGCTGRADVDEQIRRFHRHLAADVPPHFEAFFREVRHKVDPLTPVTRLRVFKLDGGPALLHHLATDEVLRRHVLKAEGPHILVDEKHVGAVRDRLQALGYLMPR